MSHHASHVDPLALFVLTSLAAFRLTMLVQRDVVSLRARERFFDRFPPNGQRATTRSLWRKVDRTVVFSARMEAEARPVSVLGQMVECAWCLGWWISLATWAVLWSVVDLPMPALWPVAMSGVVGVLAGVGR